MYSTEILDVVAAKLLEQWSATKRNTVSLDIDTYKRLFPFLQVKGVIKKKGTDKIAIVMFDRERAIQQIKTNRNLKYGPTSLCRD